jgi:hypothetical protein
MALLRASLRDADVPLPRGIYRAKYVRGEDWVKTNGDWGVKVFWTVTGPTCAGREFSDLAILCGSEGGEKMGKRKLVEMAQACGCADPQGLSDTDELAGPEVCVAVTPGRKGYENFPQYQWHHVSQFGVLAKLEAEEAGDGAAPAPPPPPPGQSPPPRRVAPPAPPAPPAAPPMEAQAPLEGEAEEGEAAAAEPDAVIEPEPEPEPEAEPEAEAAPAPAPAAPARAKVPPPRKGVQAAPEGKPVWADQG